MLPIEQQVKDLVDNILEDYQLGRDIDNPDVSCHPDRDTIIDILQKLRQIVFPGFSGDKSYRIYDAKHNLSMLLQDAMLDLSRQIIRVFHNERLADDEAETKAFDICIEFFKRIPSIRAMIQTDLQASFDGDPSASCKTEIIFSYPGLFAITVYRLAHELYVLNVPMIPRMMTEYSHSVTGIDIHPGATIGKYFFIDHGTGIVIGETTEIGKGVKIYQGVTLGALTTRGGQTLRGHKRHPTIEDNVTIYAGASILGGNTIIGRNSVIGSNAFITKSIPPYTTVSIKNQELRFRAHSCGD